jgi:hypothetical protein
MVYVGQAIIPTIREAGFDSDIAVFGIANVSKATAHRNEQRGIRIRSPAAQIPNHRHRQLLRPRRKRTKPPRRRAQR